MTREIVLDTETTGLDPRTGHRLIEIACIELEDYLPTGRSFHRYCHPDREIDPDAQRVHGISLAFLADKPRFHQPEIWSEMVDFIGDSMLVAHNAPFDRGFLQRASEQTGVGLVFAIHDTLPLARQAWPTLGAYKLRVLSAHVGAPPPTHRGLSDARAALAVLMAARSVVIPSSQAQTGASALAD